MTLLFFMVSIFTPVLVFLALWVTMKSRQDAAKIGSDPQPEETSMPGSKPSIRCLLSDVNHNLLHCSQLLQLPSCASKSEMKGVLSYISLRVSQVQENLQHLLERRVYSDDVKGLGSLTTTLKSAKPSPSEP